MDAAVTQLHYYRCVDCLSVATATDYNPRGVCGHCAGRLEYLGRVQGARLVETQELCKCDGRCVFARGPNCDCACRGANHGHGWFGGGFEVVDTDRGPVPRLRMVADKQAAATAAEWRAACEALAAATLAADTSGDWRRRYALQDCRIAARASRSHKHRMEKIRQLLPELKPADVRPVCQVTLF